MSKRPLLIRAYWDTRPGHVKQTRGLIQALAELTPVEVTDVFLLEYGFWRSFSDWAGFIFSFFKPRKQIHPRQIDLIMGTGSHTHIPMLLYKQSNKGRIVTCMTPDWPLAKHMDLCFIPEHDSPEKADNVFITTGPPNTARNKHDHDPGRGLVVIGGTDKKTHNWDNNKIIIQIRDILKTQTDIAWTVSTSPRTPQKMIPMLEKLGKEFSTVSFKPFEKTFPGWIEDQYAKSEFVWVSADSVSMVYEALSAGCRVGVLSVEWKNKQGKLARAIELLAKNNKILTFDAWKNKSAWPGHSGLNEAHRCAVEILQRWWPHRL